MISQKKIMVVHIGCLEGFYRGLIAEVSHVFGRFYRGFTPCFMLHFRCWWSGVREVFR